MAKALQTSMDMEKTRTGTTWTATAHVITGTIGAGVLSLGWCTAQLGWIAGPICVVMFAAITQVSNYLLCDLYKSPDPESGPIRNRSLTEAVKCYLGKKKEIICTLFLMESFYGLGIAFNIVTASCVRAILQSNCYHEDGHDAKCKYGENTYMLLFGLTQIVVSQIPGFHEMAWLSVVAAVMSICYASIGVGLGIATVIGNGKIMGSIGGVPATNSAQKSWLVFQALGDIAFAYPYTQILLEIQDTLKSPPSENKTMKKVATISILIVTFFFLCCGGFGYAAFGDQTPGNLLTGFGFYEPYWLVDFANACIILHLVGGYQVYSQPVFAYVERLLAKKYPDSKLINKFYTCKLPLLPSLRLNMNISRLCFRTAYVASTTGVAMIFPYFNQVLGVLGAVNFWPITIYFPLEMYIVQSKTTPWTRKWVALQSLSLFCLAISVAALIGSVEGLVRAKLS